MFDNFIRLILFLPFVMTSMNDTEEVLQPLTVPPFFDFEESIEENPQTITELPVPTTTAQPAVPIFNLDTSTLTESGINFGKDGAQERDPFAGNIAHRGNYDEGLETFNYHYNEYGASYDESEDNIHINEGYSDQSNNLNEGREGSSEGYSDEGEGHYSGYTVERLPAGPYGNASYNYNCVETSETLYVTQSEWTVERHCYNVYRVECREGVQDGKAIGYEDQCNEFTQTKCRTVYDTNSEERCWMVNKNKCTMEYETVTEWQYQEECVTSYVKECHGYGKLKTCESVPEDHCKQIPKKVKKQLPKTKCMKVPEKRCQDFPINIPRRDCKEFPKTVCIKEPISVKKEIPTKTCEQIPKEICRDIPRQIVKDVPKTVNKKVCTSTKQNSYETQSYPPSNIVVTPPAHLRPTDDYAQFGPPAYSQARDYEQHSVPLVSIWF